MFDNLIKAFNEQTLIRWGTSHIPNYSLLGRVMEITSDNCVRFQHLNPVNHELIGEVLVPIVDVRWLDLSPIQDIKKALEKRLI